MGNLSNLFVSRSFQSLIHLATDNTASANLIGLEDGLGNPIGVSVNTAGNLSISGSFTASLQNGYVWVGNSSGKTTTAPTSSFGTPIPTGTISGSSQITALGFVSSSITASSLITASFDNGTRNLTFTKGDAQTFSINIPDVSGSTINTGSFATTGSNQFNGNQTVNGFVSASNGFYSGPNTTALSIGDSANIRFWSGSTGGSEYYNIQLVPGVGDIAFSRSGASNVKVLTLAGVAGNTTTFQNNPVEFQSNVGGVSMFTPLAINAGVNSNLDVTGSLKVSSTLTASLQQGYVWVGDGSGRTTTVATSSFSGGSVSTGSLLLTASASPTANTITFTKGDNTTFDVTLSVTASTTASFDTGSFATTGSNTFTGDQTLIDNAGNFFTITDASGSMMLVAKGFTSASAHISASSAGIGNFIFKTNSNTPDTIVSGSNNIFVNPSAPTAGFKRYMTGGNISIGGSGAAVPQISGSMGFSPTIANNYFGVAANPITLRGPVSSSAYNLNNNVLAGGAINLGTAAATNFERAIVGLNMNNNILPGTINAVASKTQLSASVNINNNNIGGTAVLNMDSSSIGFSGNIVQGTITVNNSYFPATTGSQVAASVNGGLYFGTNTIFLSGSNTTFTGAPGRTITNAVILGTNNVLSASLNGDLAQVASTALIGQGLVVVGSNSRTAGASAADWGSVFVGRWNSDLGTSDMTGETIFAVGTGTGASTRKTGFLIDSGSNTFVEGTLNVSGATSLNGNLNITGSLTASLQQGYVWVGNASGLTTTVATSSFGGGGGTIPAGTVSSSQQILDYNIFATTGSNTFIGNQRITGSLDASGSTIILRAERNVLSPVQLDLGSTATGDISMFANDVNITVNSGDVKITNTGANRGIQISGPDPSIGLRDTSAPNNPFIALTNKNERLEITDASATIATFSTASVDIYAPLNVSGSTILSGSLFINNLQNGVTADVVTYDTTTGELRKASLAAITSASFDAAEFWSTTTQSGSAGVSGSITFNNSGSVAGISVQNNSQVTVSQVGTYNIQFSAQIETSAGADTVYLWFKKNGNNISDSASKAVLANNTAQIMTVNLFDEAVANDYYELAYQTTNGHATVLYEAASGNIPAIPSVILTINQIR